MTTAYDVPPQELIDATAKKLESIESIDPPLWADFAKTGIHKERPPTDEDWWHVRTAALLRKVYMNGPIGVERLAGMYGGIRDRGSKPNRTKKGSRSIIRKSLMQLEEAGFVAKDKNKGRVVTSEGQSFLDNIANEISQ